MRQREARGLALITLAHENAKASGKEPKWIGDLYDEAFAKSDLATRKEAAALLPELGATSVAATETSLSAKPAEPDHAAGAWRCGKAGRAGRCHRVATRGRHPAQQARRAACRPDRALGRLRLPEHRRLRPQALIGLD